MEITVPKKWLAQAAGLAKLTVSTLSQHAGSLDHAKIKISHDSMRIISTDDSSAADITISLLSEIPELLDDPVTFWVKPAPLADLIHHETDENFTFCLDLKKASFSAIIESAKLVLPIKTDVDWPSIEDRFVPIEESLPVTSALFKELLGFNRFFLSGQDPSKNLIEIRSSMAISTDRVKFGFFYAPSLNGLELRIPGDQLAPLESSMAFLPDQITISASSAYTLFQGKEDGFTVTLGVSKTNYMLGQSLDAVPEYREPERIYTDRKRLTSSLTKLLSVSNKLDPRLKLTFSGAGTDGKLTLTTVNELNQDSMDAIAVNRAFGETSQSVSVIVPLGVFFKALKMATSDNLWITLESKTPKYLKMCEDRGHAYAFSVFQALSGLKV